MTGSVPLFAYLPTNPPIGLTNSLEVWLSDHELVAFIAPPIDPEHGLDGGRPILTAFRRDPPRIGGLFCGSIRFLM